MAIHSSGVVKATGKNQKSQYLNVLNHETENERKYVVIASENIIQGNYGSSYRLAYILTPYLASINNLASAVVKTTDKTMKITYELTEEDS